jgi:GTP cyclohydrolase IA
MIDQNKIKEAVRLIIEAIGEEPEREGLLETPDRIARMYSEVFSGLEESAEEHLSRTFTVDHDDIVLEKDINFYSMCEHHFLPFYGKVHVAYIPNGKVAGLSKLARTVEVFAKRPQLQERMTVQIAEALVQYLNAKGAMVVIEAEHLCMNMRGVKKPGTKTKTVAVRGVFQGNNELKSEVYSLLRD